MPQKRQGSGPIKGMCVCVSGDWLEALIEYLYVHLSNPYLPRTHIPTTHIHTNTLTNFPLKRFTSQRSARGPLRRGYRGRACLSMRMGRRQRRGRLWIKTGLPWHFIGEYIGVCMCVYVCVCICVCVYICVYVCG